MKETDRLTLEIESLRSRLSRMSKASLRIAEDLDRDTALQEIADEARFADATGRQVVPLAGRQMYCAVARLPGDAVRQKVGQGAVDGRVRLAEDERQIRRIDEGRPAESVEQLSVGERHVLSLTIIVLQRCSSARPS